MAPNVPTHAAGCVCELCSCGHHRCPHRPKQKVSGGDITLSEYTNKFKAYQDSKVRDRIRPEECLRPESGRISDSTTHRIDYVLRDGQRPPLHQPDRYSKPDGNIDLLTSYTKDYPGRKAEFVRAFKDQKTHAPSGTFGETPTYVDDYRRWDLPTRTQAKDHSSFRPPSGCFDGISTFARDYQEKKIDVRKSLRPCNSTKLSEGPFQDETSQRVSYIPHSPQARFVRQQEPYQKSPHKFDNITTFQRDFVNKKGERRAEFRPEQTSLNPNRPFIDDTTFKSDYQKWKINPVQSYAPEGYEKPAGDMELYTTHNLAYQGHQVRPASARRPISQGHKSDAAFDDRTNYTDDYRQWALKPERRGNPTQKCYERPEVAFEGMSNYQMQYVAKRTEQVKGMGPDRTPRINTNPFDDRTSYKSNFTGRPPSPCIAANLKASGYEFSHLDQRGHEVYRLTSERPFKNKAEQPPFVVVN